MREVDKNHLFSWGNAFLIQMLVIMTFDFLEKYRYVIVDKLKVKLNFDKININGRIIC